MVLIEQLRLQAETQALTLTNCVLALARGPSGPEQLDACASAARSFEGTAHTVGLHAAAELARTMEECFVAVRRGDIELQQELIGLISQSAELLSCMAKLPRDASTPQHEPEEAGKQPRSAMKRVLVADDSRETRDLERDVLASGGYEVTVVASGIEAWHAILNGSFSLLLTDVDMPLLDGIQLTRLLRKDHRFRQLPILVACDRDNVQQRWCAFDAGADYYVIKERVGETLVETITNLIGPARA